MNRFLVKATVLDFFRSLLGRVPKSKAGQKQQELTYRDRERLKTADIEAALQMFRAQRDLLQNLKFQDAVNDVLKSKSSPVM
jgi:hypothetical protein